MNFTYIAIPYGAVGRFEREALMVWKEPHMKGDSRAGNQQHGSTQYCTNSFGISLCFRYDLP